MTALASKTYMTDGERSVLPELLYAVAQIPERNRQFILGYATALIDAGITEKKETNNGRD